MASNLQFVVYDPVSDTKVTWDMEGEERFGITLKNLSAKIINAVAEKKDVHPMQVMSDGSMSRVVIRVEPKTKGRT